MILELLKELWSVWVEMFTKSKDLFLRFLIFVIWAISGIFILACVYVANDLYPKWTEWGEEL